MFSDKVYFYYFLIHTPITILMDATICIPFEYQLKIQQKLSTFHVTTNKDFLCAEPELWFQLFVIWELIFQLPLFIYAVYDYSRNGFKFYSPKLWPAFLLYGFNAGFTTMICLIYAIIYSPSKGLTIAETANLASLYIPTMILPFYMMYDFYIRILNQLSVKKKNI